MSQKSFASTSYPELRKTLITFFIVGKVGDGIHVGTNLKTSIYEK